MFLQAYVWAALLLPVWAVLMWRPASPTTPTTDRTAMTVAEIGFLRGGTLGALGTAATELYIDDLVDIHRRGFIRGPGPMHPGVSQLGQAIYSALTRRANFWMLRFRPAVRRVTSELSIRLAAHGLVPGGVRWFLTRGILLALATASILQLLVTSTTPVSALLCFIVLLAAAAASFVPRRTLAGNRRLAALRDGKGEVVVSARKRAEVWTVRDEPVVAFALDGDPVPALDRVLRLRLLSRVLPALASLLSSGRGYRSNPLTQWRRRRLMDFLQRRSGRLDAGSASRGAGSRGRSRRRSARHGGGSGTTPFQ